VAGEWYPSSASHLMPRDGALPIVLSPTEATALTGAFCEVLPLRHILLRSLMPLAISLLSFHRLVAPVVQALFQRESRIGFILHRRPPALLPTTLSRTCAPRNPAPNAPGPGFPLAFNLPLPLLTPTTSLPGPLMSTCSCRSWKLI